MEQLNDVLQLISDTTYTYVVVWLIALCGIYFTFKTRFSQFRLFPDSIKYMGEKSGKGEVSSFQALMMCTASKVGTANIAGVAMAIVTGGPGAIFWMWLMSIFGSASSVVVTQNQKLT